MTNDRFLPKLSQNLIEILSDEEYYDITIEVGSDPYAKVFRAHMVILNYRSPYLCKILSTNKKKNDGILTNIKLPNISPEFFHVLLRYIYGGSLSLEEYDISDIIKILVTANELSLQELIPYIESFLIKNKTKWLNQNFELIYQTSFGNDSFPELQRYCIDFISKESSNLFNSPRFTSIPEKLLVTIIQNDNHQMSEIQVWKHVIKWGLAQNPDLPSDHTIFSKDDFNSLKITLQHCIPFIKFHNLTSKEFLHNIFPYREILPKELCMDLLKTFLNSDYKPSNKFSDYKLSEKFSSKSVDSVIISNQHVELISKWINKLEITNTLTTPYEFKLLYRDSRDGSSNLSSKFIKFREICKNQSRTVTIIKVKDSNEILGGYNPLEWKFDHSYGVTKDSFIFSFSNDSIDNYILSRVKNDEQAIFYSPWYNEGPSFGCKDLHLYRNLANELRIDCKKRSYESQLKETNCSFFSEFEVFQIM